MFPFTVVFPLTVPNPDKSPSFRFPTWIIRVCFPVISKNEMFLQISQEHVKLIIQALELVLFEELALGSTTIVTIRPLTSKMLSESSQVFFFVRVQGASPRLLYLFLLSSLVGLTLGNEVVSWWNVLFSSKKFALFGLGSILFFIMWVRARSLEIIVLQTSASVKNSSLWNSFCAYLAIGPYNLLYDIKIVL